jgi:thiamine biosynthesis lipoprotein
VESILEWEPFCQHWNGIWIARRDDYIIGVSASDSHLSWWGGPSIAIQFHYSSASDPHPLFPTMNSIEFHAMGCRMMAVVDNESPAAESALKNLPVWFEDWEQVLSRFRFDSELSRLNRSAGQSVEVSETLAEVFQAARRAENFTGGLVRPTILDALIDAGYDRSFDLMSAARVTAPEAGLALPHLTTVIDWDASTRTLFLPEFGHLDFGGVAKGWATGQAVDRLKQFGPTLVDAGGDIAISCLRADGQPWSVGILDPFRPETHFETLRLERGGVATSGTDYHRWQVDGGWRHHLIDPGTGLPAESDVLTATVIAPDALLAEAAAKAVVIAGGQSGLEWLESDPTLAGVLILQSGEALYSRRMPAYLWS